MRTGKSIYRQHTGLIYAIADPARATNWREPVSQDGSSEFVRQRRASPVAFLLRNTQKWIDTLPRSVRPHALCKMYPRIANPIAATWMDKKALDAYFDELLVDRRQGRRGFPPDVYDDLSRLRKYRAGVHSGNVDKSDDERRNE